MLLANPQRRFVNLFNFYDQQRVTGGATVTAAPVVLMTTSSFNVIVDSFVMVQANFIITKGGVAGRTAFTLYKSSGTGNLNYINDPITAGATMRPHIEHPHIQVAEVWVDNRYWIFRANVSGSIVLRLDALSAGSDSVIAANQCAMEVFLFL